MTAFRYVNFSSRQFAFVLFRPLNPEMTDKLHFNQARRLMRDARYISQELLKE